MPCIQYFLSGVSETVSEGERTYVCLKQNSLMQHGILHARWDLRLELENLADFGKTKRK